LRWVGKKRKPECNSNRVTRCRSGGRGARNGRSGVSFLYVETMEGCYTESGARRNSGGRTGRKRRQMELILSISNGLKRKRSGLTYP